MFTSFERILLATEGTEFDVGAERVAMELAVKCHSPLLAVRPVVSNPVYESVAPKLALRAEAEAAAQLDALRRTAGTQGVELSGTVRLGEEPYQEIIDEARERAADLIVLRRRGKHGFFANLLVGAMVNAVIGHAPCDVLIVPRAARMWSRGIVLATDGSPHSERATEAAAYIGMRCELPVVVVCAAGPQQAQDGPAAADIVERALGQMRAAGAEASGRVVSGRPHEAILEVVRAVGADLIVVGRRGHGGVDRLLLGSTSERVAGYADCPVFVVRA